MLGLPSERNVPQSVQHLQVFMNHIHFGWPISSFCSRSCKVVILRTFFYLGSTYNFCRQSINNGTEIRFQTAHYENNSPTPCFSNHRKVLIPNQICDHNEVAKLCVLLKLCVLPSCPAPLGSLFFFSRNKLTYHQIYRSIRSIFNLI